MITLDDYFGRMTRVHGGEPTSYEHANAMELLRRVNALLAELQANAEPVQAPTIRPVNSGWRTPVYNAAVPNAAPRSKHISAEAVDLADPEGDLDNFLFADWERRGTESYLTRHDLYMEHPLATKGWTHLQSVPPRSGNRIFYP